MAQPVFFPVVVLYTVQGKSGEILYGKIGSEVAAVVAADKSAKEPNVERFKLYFTTPVDAYDKQVTALKKGLPPVAAQEQSVPPAVAPAPAPAPMAHEPKNVTPPATTQQENTTNTTANTAAAPRMREPGEDEE